MSTLLFERSLPRFAAARVVSSFGSGRGAGVGPLRLIERDAPAVPAADWVHVDPVLSGICGSDLATLDGRSSRYFEDIVSFPFVPGHEVVGTKGKETMSSK
jgi:threonine dehydrogenase-like Zn-dependent dehydrogenase